MTRLMGILNATPDSFFMPARFHDLDSAIKRGVEIFQEGADIIDIGGESTRPYATAVSEEDELERVIPLVKALKPLIPIPLSIDTYKPGVATAAIEVGATFINDVTGFQNSAMRRLAAETGVGICVMHMKGTPATMQIDPVYPEGVIQHLVQWFKERVDLLIKDGVAEKQIILDPGIGFGKTIAHNLEIVQNLQMLKGIGFPLLLGSSRKSFLSKILNKPTSDLLSGTLAINTAAIIGGADIIRVHDVKEHRDVLKVVENLMRKEDV